MRRPSTLEPLLVASSEEAALSTILLLWTTLSWMVEAPRSWAWDTPRGPTTVLAMQ